MKNRISTGGKFTWTAKFRAGYMSGLRNRVRLLVMKQLPFLDFTARDCRVSLLIVIIAFCSIRSFGQSSTGWKLEKMPADLETDFALSSLPPYIRGGATVYLLDPDKGFYVARQGTNGFICFVLRTYWELAEFRQDLASAISYDAEGAKTIFPVYADVEAMRASGKFTAAQIKDTISARFAQGYYKAPARAGLSYMLAPVMMSYVGHQGSDGHVQAFILPHYMFYAPYVSTEDIGGNSPSGGPTILGDGKGPHGYIMVPVGAMEKAQMSEENAPLLKRLIAYKA